ncbi:MAG: biopolymer transporter ExbD [Myxococcales bacterium FL481]|nr:MAG: biopolymer transporter ExbD [Myxococcales bacterium FL481]
MAGIITSSDAAAGDEPLAAINVTSLVDVMFCLLIMFMVATPLMSKAQRVELPKAPGAKISAEAFKFSFITIDASGQVFVGDLPLARDTEKMTEELSTNARLKEQGMAFIQGDAKVPYERIVDVLVALKQAGIADVGFVTDPRVGKTR